MCMGGLVVNLCMNYLQLGNILEVQNRIVEIHPEVLLPRYSRKNCRVIDAEVSFTHNISGGFLHCHCGYKKFLVDCVSSTTAVQSTFYLWYMPTFIGKLQLQHVYKSL